MKRHFLLLLILLTTLGVYAQNKVVPEWFSQTFKSKGLNAKYDLAKFAKPSFFQTDLNGDKIEDVVALVINKVSKKTGLLIIHKGSNQYYLIGAGTKFGKIGFDDFDEMKWMDGWKIIKDRVVYETKFDNGDIIGSIKRNLKNNSISVWNTQDGSPLYGGIIYWNGTKYSWIHQGE